MQQNQSNPLLINCEKIVTVYNKPSENKIGKMSYKFVIEKKSFVQPHHGTVLRLWMINNIITLAFIFSLIRDSFFLSLLCFPFLLLSILVFLLLLLFLLFIFIFPFPFHFPFHFPCPFSIFSLLFSFSLCLFLFFFSFYFPFSYFLFSLFFFFFLFFKGDIKFRSHNQLRTWHKH